MMRATRLAAALALVAGGMAGQTAALAQEAVPVEDGRIFCGLMSSPAGSAQN